MAKGGYRYTLRLLVVFGCLMFMAGCDLTMVSAPPVELSTALTDVASFVQQFAQEALAAFLF